MPLKTSQDELPTVNLTPMIDVVFLLLIFFMVSTNFNDNESRIDLQVPKVSGANALVAAPESRVVNVGKDGSITLDQKVLSLAELVSKLRAAKQQYADTTVIVRADVESSFRRVAEVFGACNDAGVRISLSVRPGSVVR